MNKETTYLLT